jgi:predicted DNA-binding transcriptional regulator YafY
MNRTDRLYALAEELRFAGERGRTSADLARQFEVSTRTVKRDLAALQQAGMPIWSEGGPGGGYRLLPSSTDLPAVTFTPGEAVAIAVALGSQPHLPFATDGRAALTKLLDAMQPEGRAEASGLAARVWVTGDADDRGAAARVLDESMRGGTVALIDYVDAAGGRTEQRPVEPMAFVQLVGWWYLLAWCRLRRAGRWFRLDRIEHAVPTRRHAPERTILDVFGEPPPGAGPISRGWPDGSAEVGSG